MLDKGTAIGRQPDKHEKNLLKKFGDPGGVLQFAVFHTLGCDPGAWVTALSFCFWLRPGCCRLFVPALGLHCGEWEAIDKGVLKLRLRRKSDVLDRAGETERRGEQRHFRALQGGIAGGVNPAWRRFEQPDADRAVDADIIAESSGQVHNLDHVGFRSPAPEQQAHSGGDCALRQLQLADIVLGECHGFDEGKFPRLVRKLSAEQDRAQVEPRRYGIHQPAAADTAWRSIADHVAFECGIAEKHVGDGSAGCAYAHSDRGGFEGGSGGGRGAEDAVAVAQNDLSVGAEIDEGAQAITARQVDRNDPRENIGSCETAQTGQKSNPAGGRQGPAELFWPKTLLAGVFRHERSMRKRFDVQAGKQVVHHRVSHQHDLFDFLGTRTGKFSDHAADPPRIRGVSP